MTTVKLVDKNVPDEHRGWSDSENYFNNQIRNLTIELLVFGIALIISHFQIRKWRRPVEVELPDLKNLSDVQYVKLKQENKDDHLIYRLAQLSCTFAVSIGFLCLILIPISVLSNEIKVFCLHSCPYWWLEWLSADLLLEAWNRVSVLTSFFLFIVLPFTFFLIEADGFSFGPRYGLRAKFYETFITLLLIFAFVLLFFFVLLALLGARFDVTSSWISLLPKLVTELTPMLRTCLSFCAIFLLLIGVPFGQQILLENATQAILIIKAKNGLKSDLKRNKIERDIIRNKLRKHHQLRRLSASPCELRLHEKLLNAESDRLEYLSNLSFLSRFILRPLLLIVSVLLIFCGISICLFRSIQIIFPFFIEAEITPLRFSSTHFGLTSVSKSFGYFEHPISFVKGGLAMWITISALCGFYKYMPNSWKPELFSTPLHKLILQCLLFLFLCSAVPLLNALLTGLPLPIQFSGSPALIGSAYQIVACVYYIIFSLFSIFRTLTVTKREEIMDSFKNAWDNANSPRKKEL